MKLLLRKFYLLTLLSLLFSCQSSNSEDSDLIVGEWTYAYSTRDGVITDENPCLSSNKFTFFNDMSLVHDAHIVYTNGDCTAKTYDVDAIWIKKEDEDGVYYSLRGSSSEGGIFNFPYCHISVDNTLVVGVREDGITGITGPNSRIDYYDRLDN